MAVVRSFTFNPFAENTIVVYDESKECVVFDPGCSTDLEQVELTDFIQYENLKPVRLINTHGHLDHMMGNKFIADKYGIGLEIHKDEVPVLASAPRVGAAYGVPVEASPSPKRFIEDNEVIQFGQTTMKAILAPGHSPASLCFLIESDQILIGGDVLFHMSIGRTDLPGGNYETLMKSIFERLLVLDDEVMVYPGHGEPTTIGHERNHNPFILQENRKS